MINILLNSKKTPRATCNKFQCQVSTRHLAMLNVQNFFLNGSAYTSFDFSFAIKRGVYVRP